MFRRILTVSLAAVFALLMLPVSSASAAVTTYPSCVSVATKASTAVTSCATITYRLQNDGDGLYVEKATFSITSGCAQVKSIKIDNVSYFIEKSAGVREGYSLSYQTTCSATARTINATGIDTGLTNFDLYYTVSLKDRTDPNRRDWRVNNDMDSDGVWSGVSAYAVFY
jgi:hypothetical protein